MYKWIHPKHHWIVAANLRIRGCTGGGGGGSYNNVLIVAADLKIRRDR